MNDEGQGTPARTRNPRPRSSQATRTSRNGQSEGDGSQPAGAQTLLRGLTLLECVADGVRDVQGLSARLGTPRSTTHRMLGALVAAGYLHQIPHHGYFLGSKLIGLGDKALEQRPLVALALPHCERLAQEVGDTVHLGTIEGPDVVYLAKVPGRRGLEMRSRVGSRMPLASTGVGRALMLGMDPDRWQALYDAALDRAGIDDTGPRLPAWEDYRRDMLTARERDIVFDREENEIGIRCVAAPLRDASGRVVAALSVASAAPFMSEQRMDEVAPAVRAVAEAISGELGWRRR